LYIAICIAENSLKLFERVPCYIGIENSDILGPFIITIPTPPYVIPFKSLLEASVYIFINSLL
jgi:hypothetical protein